MSIRGFIWDDINVQHIAWHGIAPDEVNEALLHPSVISKERFGRFSILGKTNADRYILVIIEPREDEMYYPVTAYDMDKPLKDFYLSEVKNG